MAQVYLDWSKPITLDLPEILARARYVVEVSQKGEAVGRDVYRLPCGTYAKITREIDLAYALPICFKIKYGKADTFPVTG